MKHYPPSGNYAYKTRININGISDENEKKVLLEKLERQIDDSLTYSRERDTLLRFLPYYVKKYHNYDSSSISRTKDFFKAAYVANGYFRGGETEIRFEPDNPNVKAKTVIIDAFPYLNHKIDTVIYKIKDTHLLQLVKEINKNTVLHKNDLYSQDLLDLERTRLTNHFRNNGYLYFTKDDIKVIADTVNIHLLKTANDPFEQLELLEKAIEFNKNPTTDITIALQDTLLEKKLRKYYIGNIIIQPDNLNDEIDPPYKKTLDKVRAEKQYFVDNFKNSIFENRIFLKKDSLFRQTDYDKTLLALNYLGPWQQVNISIIENVMRGDTIDFKINMLPYKRYLSNRKVEGSYNINSANNSFLTNLWGISLSQNLSNRNFIKRAIQTTASLYGSVEFGRSSDATRRRLVNTIQFGFNYNLLFPNSILIGKKNKKKQFSNQKFFLNPNINLSNRLDFFNLLDLGLSFGDQGRFTTKRKKNIDYQVNLPIPTFEFKKLRTTTSFQEILNNNPTLKNIYRDGLVVSLKGAMNFIKSIKEVPTKKINRYKVIKLGSEIGLPAGNNSFNFGKIEFDYRYNAINARNWFALRLFIGAGKSYNERFDQNKNLPFFRQFVGGGPYSMRAWAVRNLSSYSTRNTATTNQRINESFGDAQVELNSELRFTLGKLVGIPVRFAVFADIGNIWNWKPNDPTLVPTNKSKSQLIIDDIAIAMGPSVRFDFNYFLLRFDIGAKIKEPLTIDGTGGTLLKRNFDLNALRLQIGVGYPF